LAYAITVAYSYRHHFPFSTYGENVFLSAQNTVIALLIIAFSGGRHEEDAATKLAAAFVFIFGSGYLLSIFSPEKLAVLQLATLPLSVASKIPQIRENARTQSTGQLSSIAILAQIAGCVARLFTTTTEVGDPIMTAGFAVALLLNCVLGMQLWIYRGRAPTLKVKEEKVRVPAEIVADEKASGSILSEKGTGQVQWGAPAPGSTTTRRAATPQPSSRRWSRKVD
jgi:mannose-P-dolichol utilization defect 1